MLAFQGVLSGIATNGLYCKKQIKGGKFLYAFLDQTKFNREATTFLSNAKNSSINTYQIMEL